MRVRNDPVVDAFPGQELVYGLVQSAWSAWARRRFRDSFDQVASFVLFVGYPRSGHSLVGAMLNAHRNAVIAHELDAPKLVVRGCTRDELYSRILARAAWFNLRGNASNYEYQVPNRWQGRFEALRLVGDKRGGSAAQWLARHPDLLGRLRATVGVPLRLIHVVRNPYDNIAAIARWHGLSLDRSIDFYFSHCETTGPLAASGASEMVTLAHEDLVREPEAALAGLCSNLGLATDPEYLAACASIVFARPTHSRRQATWSVGQVAEVKRRARRYPFLDRYDFEIAETGADGISAAGSRSVSPGAGRRSAFASGADRLSAFLAPRVGEAPPGTPGVGPR